MNENTTLIQVVKELQSSNLSQELILETVDNYNFTLASAAARENTTDVPVFLQKLINIALDLKKQLSTLARLNLANVNNTSSNTNTNTLSRIPNAAPSTGVGNIELPDFKNLAKGVMLNAIPTSLIKSYVGGIQKLVDEVSKIRIDKSTIEGIIKPLNLLSSAIDGIANINLTRAMIGLVKFKIFNKVLTIAFKGAASPENLKAAKNLKQLSAALSPLEKIGESLTAFANIKWVKTLLSVKALKLFLGSLSKLPIEIIKKFTDVIKKIASGIVKPMKLISDSIGYFGEKLGKVSGALLKGALGILALSVSMIPLAYSLKLFKDIDLKTVAVAAAAVGGLALAASALGKNMGMVLKGTLLIAALGASIIPLAYSLKMIQGVKWETLGIVATAITGLGLAAAALGVPAVAALVALGSVVIALLGASLIPLAYSLKKIGEIDADVLGPIGKAIGDLGMGLLKGAAGLALGGLAMIPFSAGVLALGAATALVGGGLGDFFEKFTSFSDGLDPAKIFDSAAAITALALAIAGFGAAQAAEGLGNLVGKLLRFGSDSPLEQFQKFASISTGLDVSAKAIKELASGIEALGKLGGSIQVLDDFPWGELENLAEEIEGKAIIQVILNDSKASSNILQGKDATSADKFSKMSKEEKAAEAGYKSYDEYEKAKFAWKGKDNIQTIPPSTGNTLATAGNVAGAATTVVVNNNSGGNVSNVSSSNVNNNASPIMPIMTGSGMGFYSPSY